MESPLDKYRQFSRQSPKNAKIRLDGRIISVYSGGVICSLPGRQAKKQKAYCPEGGILCLSTRLIQQRNCRLYIAKLQNKFHVSAAEVDEQDTHQIIDEERELR